jgi:allophanate hydrolase subunit 1
MKNWKWLQIRRSSSGVFQPGASELFLLLPGQVVKFESESFGFCENSVGKNGCE